MDRYVFAAVKYANAAPLAHFLPDVDERATVTFGRPSELLAELAGGRADAALVPVAVFLATPGLRMVDGIGICADGRVESVLLKCHKPLAEVRLVAPDASSRTSNALAAILLNEHLGLSAEVRPVEPGEQADAMVCIGDRALCEAPAPEGDYDMAAMWKEMTGLPFVFAVWAYREDCRDPDGISNIARAAREMGLARIDELAALHAEKLDLPVQRCREYFNSSVRYEVGPREAQAIELFGRKLTQYGRLGPETFLPTWEPGKEAR